MSIILVLGISRADFYDSTFGEIADIMKLDLKRRARQVYENALLTSSFIMLRYGGKEVPEISEIYNELFEGKSDIDKFREFVALHNAQRKMKNGV